MKNYDFDVQIDRRNSGSIKWDLFGDDVLPLWVADMDFPVMDEIITALNSRINHPFFGYQSQDPTMVEAICEWNFKRHQWKVDPNEVLLMPGVVSGFNWVASALVKENESIAFQTPVYFPFYKVSTNQHIKQVEIPLLYTDDGYQIDFDIFEDQIEQGTRLFLLCNPHNPVGRVFNKEELYQIGRICIDHDIWICSDEIHSDLVFNGHKHIPIASLSPELADRTVTLMAPSKTFNIPGLQFSYAICRNRQMREKLEKARRGLLEQPNILAYTAAKAAYTNGEQWLQALLAYLEGNRDYLASYLSANIPEIRYILPQGTYLAWLDCEPLNLQPSPCDFFLKYAKVALNDGKAFGNDATQFVRLNFACPRTILQKALDNMAKGLPDH
jgi:cystathionine beta-lyase